jgi:primosomal protein N'
MAVLCESCGTVVDAHRESAVLRVGLCPACGARTLTAETCSCCGDDLGEWPFCWCDSGDCRCGRPRADGYES